MIKILINIMDNKNKNKIINQKILFFPHGFIIPPIKEKYNLFEDYNIIHYNGVTMPRISLINPFLIKPFIPPLIKMSTDKYNESFNSEKQPEIIINLSESENTKSEIESEYNKKIDNSELNNTKENKNINNCNLINKDKNINLKSLDFINKVGNIKEQEKFIYNKNNSCNQGILNTHNNIIKNQIKSQMNFINFEYYNPLNFRENKIITNEKSPLKMFKIEEDLSSISSSNNSKSDKTKKIKNFFIVNEIIDSEIDKKEKETKEQNILISTKRGRKQNKNNNKKTHEATDDDNIHRKIQVHFISFITHFINDIIKTFIKSRNETLFKNIDYKLKKIVNQKYFHDLKSKKIAEIIKMRPSPKMKNHESFVNEGIYNKVCRLCPFMFEFLEQNFMTFFKEYYYSNKNKIYFVNGKQIIISERTKNFNDLINKNYAYKEKIKFIVLNNFFEDDRAFEKIKFKTNHEGNKDINNE